MNLLPTALLLLSALLTGLVAGLFYGYSCSVNPGLGKLDDAGYLLAMQCINRAILNPVFFASFIGATPALAAACWLLWGTPAGWWLLAALLLYVVAVFGLTGAGNVPLNNALDRMDLGAASATQLADYRARFEGPWNRLHTVRTLASIASFLLVVVAGLAR